jgi:hypothetical protein
MIYQAQELKAYLNNLQLVGQNEYGELEWIGEQHEWDNAREDAEQYPCDLCNKIDCDCDEQYEQAVDYYLN